ncbi:MAG: primosomal protein N' [Pseudobdellovibrionaceae bacterium]
MAVNAPIDEALTYSHPANQDLPLARGARVQVPLGKRHIDGVILNSTTPPVNPEFQIKAIHSLLGDDRPLSDSYLKWVEWIAEYYCYPVGSVIATAYPPLEKKSSVRKSKKSPVVPQVELVRPPILTDEQQTAVAQITSNSDFSTHLLYGVTGSGKTEVYLEALSKVLAQGKSGMFLVPEISLTPQLVHRFAKRFGNQIAVLHSQLTDRERTNQWWDIQEGRKSILIGARSALFCPMDNLGLIVIDEEHEPSFKQEEKLKYHARDCAVMLGKFMNCPVVLGSATPSLETWHNVQSGKYKMHRLTKRALAQTLPQIHVVDMRKPTGDEVPEINPLKNENQFPSWLSLELFNALEENFNNKKQSALFLNRRGVSPTVLCQGCGYVEECPNCDISLTLHGKSHLVCHYCDYHRPLEFLCPECKEGELKPIGLGTEQVEVDLQKLFPTAKVARADRDEVQTREAMEELVEKMENHEIDFLVGTQMIAKGLDFKHLTLVGFVLADIGFNLPDFRSPERSFQLLTQMSGRAGRHILEDEAPGQVYIQTYNPEYVSLEYAQRNDFEGFARTEFQARESLGYPPFGKLMAIRFQGLDKRKVEQSAEAFVRRAEILIEKNQQFSELHVLGPSEAPLAKLRGQYRFHVLLKSNTGKILNKSYRILRGDEAWLQKGVRMIVDVDPASLL